MRKGSTEVGRTLRRTRSSTALVHNRSHHETAGVISTYVLLLRQRKGTLASQYLALMARRTRAASPGGRMRAVPEDSGPVILPLIVQGGRPSPTVRLWDAASRFRSPPTFGAKCELPSG